MAITLAQIQNALDNWWQNLNHRPRLLHLAAQVAKRWAQVDPASVGWLRPLGLVPGSDGQGTVILIEVEQASHVKNTLELRPTPGLRTDGLTLDDIEFLGATNRDTTQDPLPGDAAPVSQGA